MDDLIKQGAIAFKAGEVETARKLLAEAVKQFPDDERAWGWMYNVCTTDQERILCLKQMIHINPKNEKAQNILFNLENQTINSSIPVSSKEVTPTTPLLAQQFLENKEVKICAVFSLDGVQDRLEVFVDRVSITPKGVLGFLNKGIKGTKEIPFRSIIAVQFKEAGDFFNGYVQFTIPGGNESRGGIFAATKDENTVMFAAKNNTLARNIKNYIDTAVQELTVQRINPSTTSLSNEILKLAKLKEQGILSDQEFQNAKKKLIG